MAKTIDELKEQSAEVKNATVVGENTATRVGTLFNDIVEHIEQVTADGATTTQKLAPLAVTTEKLAGGAVSTEKLAGSVKQAIIYDVSALNNGIVFESISALLNNSNLDAIIPVSFRHGGMTIRFIQGSEQSPDNKYVQYFCNSKIFTTDVSAWEKMNLENEASELAQDFGIGNKLFIVGDDNTNVGRYGDFSLRGVLPKATYRVNIVNPDVDMSGVTETESSRFAIWSHNSDNTDVVLQNVIIGNSLSNYYDVTLPDNSEYLFISARCTKGAVLKTYITLPSFFVDMTKVVDTWIEGYYIPYASIGETLDISNISANEQFKYTILQCTAGDKFIINNYYGGSGGRAWMFIDSDNKVLSVSEVGMITEQLITAPQNAAKIVFNNNKSNHSDWLDYYMCIPNQINSPYLKTYATKDYVDTKVLEQKTNVVDLIMFMGQSNMAGRGETNSQHTEGFPIIIDNAGYEFRAISDSTKLYPIVEPFGVNENKTGGIDDGDLKTGSPVVSFVNAYYLQSETSVIAVSASKGGTNISQWQPSGILLPDAIQRFTDAIDFINGHCYTLRHKYMVWLQGESDGDGITSKSDYKTLFNTMFSAMKTAGIEKCLMIRIGKRSYDEAYASIIDAQTELCKENEDIIMISTALTDFRRLGYMKDSYHYYQDGYNRIGNMAGHNAGIYARYGIERMQYDSEASDNIYLSYKCN